MSKHRTYAPLFPVSPRAPESTDRVSVFFGMGDGWTAAIAHAEPRKTDESALVRTASDRWLFALSWQHDTDAPFEVVEMIHV